MRLLSMSHAAVSVDRIRLLVGLGLALLLVGCGAATSNLGSGGGDLGGPVDPPSGMDHRAYFTETTYEGTSSCLLCHTEQANDLLQTGHWNWQGISAGIDGRETETHGKTDLLNNFCIAIPSNEGRCTQCHIGQGWADDSFDFTDASALDCFVCHDQTGTYQKDPVAAGAPLPGVDLQAVAQSVGDNDGEPGRSNCGACHFFAGGGDNVKHGDLCSTLSDTTRAFDVHMATDGLDYTCQRCHETVNHGIGGMTIHSVDEGDMQTCRDCHGANPHPADSPVNSILSFHTTLACQVCHIPTFSRNRMTKVEWYWSDANTPGREPVIGEDDRPDYDRKKGSFVWADHVRPTLLWYDGKWNRKIVNDEDTYTTTPVVLAEPSAERGGEGAMIYPFKKMIGDQVVDTVNQRIMVPHLFGTLNGDNPYWGTWDWNLALEDGAAYTGQPYSGTYGFVDTVMYLTVNHEVAPKEEALGFDGCCADCHGGDQIDWEALGRTGDPFASAPSCD